MFFLIACIFIVWNWGLTPLWVNVLCTVLFGLGILAEECTGGEDK